MANTQIDISQDLTINVSQPTTAKIRDSQDLTIVITQPTTSRIRVSQDLTIYIVPRFNPATAVSFLTDFDKHVPVWPVMYAGIQFYQDDNIVFPTPVTTAQYVIVFVAT